MGSYLPSSLGSLVSGMWWVELRRREDSEDASAPCVETHLPNLSAYTTGVYHVASTWGTSFLPPLRVALVDSGAFIPSPTSLYFLLLFLFRPFSLRGLCLEPPLTYSPPFLAWLERPCLRRPRRIHSESNVLRFRRSVWSLRIYRSLRLGSVG